jgi:hypothetical protein
MFSRQDRHSLDPYQPINVISTFAMMHSHPKDGHTASSLSERVWVTDCLPLESRISVCSSFVSLRRRQVLAASLLDQSGDRKDNP